MSVVNIKGTGGSILQERSLFVGPRIPDEIKSLNKLLMTIDQSSFRLLLQVIVKDFEGKLVDASFMDKIVSDKVTEETVARIFAGLYTLLKLAIRWPSVNMKQQIFQEDLKELRIPEQFIADITSVVFGSRRPHIDANVEKQQTSLPKLESFRWRVDVTLANSSLNRVIEPSIVVDMKLSDDKHQQFEMSKAQFEELRYNVAAVLKEIEDLEKRSILRVEDKS